MGEISVNDCQAFARLKEDETCSVFLSDTFDAKTSVFFSGMSINEQIAKITAGIELLNNEIRTLVSENCHELLLEATKIDLLEEHLTHVQHRVNNLLSTLDRLKTRLSEPYNRIAHRIFLLNRLQTTCDLLRKIIRVVHLSKRLEQQCDLESSESMFPTREVTKIAQHISELISLIEGDSNLQKIETIQKDVKLAKTLEEKILNYSQEMLVKSLQKQDQTLIGTSLQVFYHFKMLDEKVSFIICEKHNLLSIRIRETFDPQYITNTKSTGPGGAVTTITVAQLNQFKSKFWSGIESLVEFICTSYFQIYCLYKVLKKKKDSTNRYFYSELITETNCVPEFLQRVNLLLSEYMQKAIKESIPIKEALEMEYPKLLKLFVGCWNQINIMDKEANAELLFRNTLQPFESAYLSRSLSILHDSVNVMFLDAAENSSTSLSVATAPSPEDIESIVKSITKELSVANVDSKLYKAVARNVSKVIQIFAGKCEQIVCNDGDSTQVIDSPTAGQILNANIVQRLESFKSKIKSIVQSENEKVIAESLNVIDSLIRTIVEPLINSVQDSIEAIILTMHQEDFSNSQSNPTQSSLYMKELQGFINRVNRDYFHLYSNSEVVGNCILQVASRTTDVFLRHVTLLRPLGNGGKIRLAADFANLEEALSAIVRVPEGSAKYYRVLRSFKPLLFQDAETIAKSPVIGSMISLFTILQFLISSFGPSELQSVHDNKGWSLSRYNKWLDEHENESERLLLIRDALESYEKRIRQQEGKAFAPVYPIILKLIQQGLTN
ncbi:conserved oligomeric Golgi complex subunit 5-like isoform X3 [Dinothrombium tinctorium]|uniref:Conserved oligomeric Golgi complex subunit 5 n=1 Tax=Dinothrombium tinctorium TaxID=1965070 RepID=A0A443RLK5_9ACAR|nr:conserved oligomeric Golgi complex subunit 5-like isoform X3 [Dinothrombium tinctorium]